MRRATRPSAAAGPIPPGNRLAARASQPSGSPRRPSSGEDEAVVPSYYRIDEASCESEWLGRVTARDGKKVTYARASTPQGRATWRREPVHDATGLPPTRRHPTFRHHGHGLLHAHMMTTTVPFPDLAPDRRRAVGLWLAVWAVMVAAVRNRIFPFSQASQDRALRRLLF